MNFRSISVEPTDARFVNFDCNECYWWVDDAGKLNISGLGVQRSLISSDLDREFYISFVLSKPSNGVGKNYRITQSTIRGYIKTAGNVYRFRSLYGLLGSENHDGGIVRAAWRAHARIYGAKLLGGWTQASPYMIFGTLEAVPDKNNKGKSIRQKTEEDGYGRRSQ